MKTLIKVSLAFLMAAGLVKFVMAATGPMEEGLTVQGMKFTTLTSSGVAFSNAGTVWMIRTSTGNGQDYVVPFDTVTFLTPGGNAFDAYTSSQVVIPYELFFSSAGAGANTAALSNGNYASWMSGNFLPYGIRIVNGLYLWFSASTSSTRGNKVTVYWTK